MAEQLPATRTRGKFLRWWRMGDYEQQCAECDALRGRLASSFACVDGVIVAARSIAAFAPAERSDCYMPRTQPA
jgi:hypothetical protein